MCYLAQGVTGNPPLVRRANLGRKVSPQRLIAAPILASSPLHRARRRSGRTSQKTYRFHELVHHSQMSFSTALAYRRVVHVPGATVAIAFLAMPKVFRIAEHFIAYLCNVLIARAGRSAPNHMPRQPRRVWTLPADRRNPKIPSVRVFNAPNIVREFIVHNGS
jgi:hypothetical protein